MTPETFEQNFQKLCSESQADGRFTPSRDIWSPRLDEDTQQLTWDQHYIYHTGWASRVLAATRPAKHIDIASLNFWAVAVSAFIPMEFYEFRPMPCKGLSSFVCGEANLTSLPFADNSIDSLSSLHTLEHIGLGRYGDAVDASGDRKAAAELVRVLAPGGQLLMAVPCGKPRLIYNMGRVYSYQMVVDMFYPLKVAEFALWTDDPQEFILNADPALVAKCEGGCGCWRFVK